MGYHGRPIPVDGRVPAGIWCDVLCRGVSRRGLLSSTYPCRASCRRFKSRRSLESSWLKSTADIQEEKADFLKAYQLCLVKYQDDPSKAKEVYAPYAQCLRELEVSIRLRAGDVRET